MRIDSTRFGSIEVRDDAVVDFPDGLIGLPGRRFALVAQSPDSPFYWLHAVDEPAIAVPVTNPWLFFSDYDVKISDEDARRLELQRPDDAEILCVVRACPELADFTVNLVSPVVINAASLLGRQVINEVGGYAVRQPLFAEVELDDVRLNSPGLQVAATA